MFVKLSYRLLPLEHQSTVQFVCRFKEALTAANDYLLFTNAAGYDRKREFIH
jgi:hypothetical protein